jgi:hypothetical protein
MGKRSAVQRCSVQRSAFSVQRSAALRERSRPYAPTFLSLCRAINCELAVYSSHFATFSTHENNADARR